MKTIKLLLELIMHSSLPCKCANCNCFNYKTVKCCYFINKPSSTREFLSSVKCSRLRELEKVTSYSKYCNMYFLQPKKCKIIISFFHSFNVLIATGQ